MVENKSSHPFMLIKSKSLKGIDTMVGGSITIPMAISVVETTISIKRNGR